MALLASSVIPYVIAAATASSATAEASGSLLVESAATEPADEWRCSSVSRSRSNGAFNGGGEDGESTGGRGAELLRVHGCNISARIDSGRQSAITKNNVATTANNTHEYGRRRRRGAPTACSSSFTFLPRPMWAPRRDHCTRAGTRWPQKLRHTPAVRWPRSPAPPLGQAWHPHATRSLCVTGTGRPS